MQLTSTENHLHRGVSALNPQLGRSPSNPYSANWNLPAGFFKGPQLPGSFQINSLIIFKFRLVQIKKD